MRPYSIRIEVSGASSVPGIHQVDVNSQWIAGIQILKLRDCFSRMLVMEKRKKTFGAYKKYDRQA